MDREGIEITEAMIEAGACRLQIYFEAGTPMQFLRSVSEEMLLAAIQRPF